MSQYKKLYVLKVVVFCVLMFFFKAILLIFNTNLPSCKSAEQMGGRSEIVNRQMVLVVIITIFVLVVLGFFFFVGGFCGFSFLFFFLN